uniref:Uncharacterized protein n=1 Tax=Nymphaea colorata TaxID=210225 RepID=A0A5K1A993_9MAGN
MVLKDNCGGGRGGGGSAGGGGGKQLKLAQSTGCRKNERHSSFGRCSGRSKMQFCASETISAACFGRFKQAGGSRTKKLYEYVKFWSAGRWQMVAGISPDSLLWATFNCSSLFNAPRLSGKGPTNSLYPMSKTTNSVRFPISSGIQDVSELLSNKSSLRVEPIRPMDLGRQPLMLLLANTTTETVEFPKFSGIVDTKLLSFMNKTSKFISKSAGGILPSNALNRMSKNLSDGRQSTTEGK